MLSLYIYMNTYIYTYKFQYHTIYTIYIYVDKHCLLPIAWSANQSTRSPVKYVQLADGCGRVKAKCLGNNGTHL